MDYVRNIVICGGTHGNELTGVFLCNNFKRKYDGLNIQTLIANPQAVKINQRYVQRDLNRCFAMSELNAPDGKLPETVEHKRAVEINNLLGRKNSENAPDLILDFHNTTANMGITLILSERDEITMRIAAELSAEFPQIHLYLQQEERSESPYLGTIAKRDICIEIGSQAHGTLNAGLYFMAEKVLDRILELIESWNSGELSKSKKSVNVWAEVKSIDYPRDSNGQITAMVHPLLQNKDYCELKNGMPIFMDFNGKEILWEGGSCYPVFINEAAYYEKGIAMSLTNKSVEEW